MTKRITRKEGLLYLKNYGTPEHVIRHCIAVTDTALKIAAALNENGKNLNLGLIEGAGILHDIGRVHEHHEVVGSEFARSIGLNEEADIILTHMKYPYFNNIENINEADIVCLSDRVVKEDKYVGLDERMEYILNKAAKNGGGEEAERKILKTKEKTRKFIKGIEEFTGKSLDEICR